jgi:hypothetical protein
MPCPFAVRARDSAAIVDARAAHLANSACALRPTRVEGAAGCAGAAAASVPGEPLLNHDMRKRGGELAGMQHASVQPTMATGTHIQARRRAGGNAACVSAANHGKRHTHSVVFVELRFLFVLIIAVDFVFFHRPVRLTRLHYNKPDRNLTFLNLIPEYKIIGAN